MGRDSRDSRCRYDDCDPPTRQPINDPGPPPPAALDALLAEADPARSGLPLPASEAARRAVALAAQLSRPLDQARASAWLCAHLLRLGQHAEVLRVAPRVLQLLAAAGRCRRRC